MDEFCGMLRELRQAKCDLSWLLNHVVQVYIGQTEPTFFRVSHREDVTLCV